MAFSAAIGTASHLRAKYERCIISLITGHLGPTNGHHGAPSLDWRVPRRRALKRRAIVPAIRPPLAAAPPAERQYRRHEDSCKNDRDTRSRGQHQPLT
jgi:hypothetical protein